ncbi:MAG: hypothetical protein ACI841_002038 [Planctomycetota bacterium]|jgi:hypothetical protein
MGRELFPGTRTWSQIRPSEVWVHEQPGASWEVEDGRATRS